MKQLSIAERICRIIMAQSFANSTTRPYILFVLCAQVELIILIVLERVAQSELAVL